ncbi:MAG: hypothetical protein AAB504_00310 [Patescibacteria group bacterium]
MSNILDDFKKTNNYFDENKKKIVEKYGDHITEFEKIYNQIVKNIPPIKISATLGTALALQYRALKFLYSAFRLVLEGHTYEAMMLVRNTLELRIIALDMGFNKEAYDLWRIAQDAKEYLKKRDGGTIDSKKLKKILKEKSGKNIINNMSFRASFQRAKINLVLLNRVNQIILSHGEISEYISHESIFNLVRRINIVKIAPEKEQVEIYMGYDASSNLEPFLQSIIKELKDLLSDIQLVAQN